MKWKIPPVIKLYEALGAVADERIIAEGDKAAVYSSEGNKQYEVVSNEAENAIMANDNGSYWVGYLGYPSIAYLMQRGILEYIPSYGEALKGIEWKKINTKNKNDFELTQQEVDKVLAEREIDLDEFYLYLAKSMKKIEELDLNILGNKILPPK